MSSAFLLELSNGLSVACSHGYSCEIWCAMFCPDPCRLGSGLPDAAAASSPPPGAAASAPDARQYKELCLINVKSEMCSKIVIEKTKEKL